MVRLPEPLFELATKAELIETPCGAGSVVWRAWGTGPPLVLLHGGWGSWRHWARNIAHLSSGHRVLAPDLPGFGDSALPPLPASDLTLPTILAEGLAIILTPGDRYDLAGFSFGTLVAGRLAAMEGDRVRSLVLVAPGALGPPRAPIVFESVRQVTGRERLAAHRANLARIMFADPARIDDLALAVQDVNVAGARLPRLGIVRSSSASLLDVLAAAPRHLAAIWGSDDAAAWPSVSARAAIITEARPDTDIRVIAGGGHWVMYERAEEFNQVFVQLLTR